MSTLDQLYAIEWRRARDSRMIAARAVSDRLARRALVYAARRVNHLLGQYLGWSQP